MLDKLLEWKERKIWGGRKIDLPAHTSLWPVKWHAVHLKVLPWTLGPTLTQEVQVRVVQLCVCERERVCVCVLGGGGSNLSNPRIINDPVISHRAFNRSTNSP